jgi:hypothetical protein
MNERDKELWSKAAEATKNDSWDEQVLFMQRFADFIRADEREALCKAMEDQNTWNWDDPADTAIQVIRARGNT